VEVGRRLVVSGGGERFTTKDTKSTKGEKGADGNMTID